MGADKMTEYLYSAPWDGYGTYYGDGIVWKQSWISGAGEWDLYVLLLHELRHNKGQDHSGWDYADVSDAEAAEICVGINRSLAAVLQRRQQSNFVSYLTRLVSEAN